MVPAVPGLPAPPGRAARRVPAAPGGRSVLRPLPARRPDGGRSTTTWRSGPRPRPRLRRLAAAGRLAVGPWYILMDEFLVSGETIIRNLQLGLDRAAAFGGAMAGRLPARHVRPHRPDAAAASPRRLRPRRGVAGRARGGGPTAFWWSAPDGSTVRAEYLRVGYGNGAALPDDAKALRAPVGGPRRRARATSCRSRRPDAVDERHRPPDAAAVAGPGGGRGQRDAGRLPPGGRLPGRVPGVRPPPKAWPSGGASCAAGPGPTC